MNSRGKTSSFSDAFRLTVVNFFEEFYKLTLNAYIYKPLLAAIAEANDHMGLIGPTSRNRQSYEKFKNSFGKCFRQGEKYILGATGLARIFKFEKLKRFFTDDK